MNWIISMKTTSGSIKDASVINRAVNLDNVITFQIDKNDKKIIRFKTVDATSVSWTFDSEQECLKAFNAVVDAAKPKMIFA